MTQWRIFIGDSLLPAMCVNSITKENRNHHYSHMLNLNEASLEIAMKEVESEYSKSSSKPNLKNILKINNKQKCHKTLTKLNT